MWSLFRKQKQKQLPTEGSTYTINKKGSAYDGMSGIVTHHADGEAFMINCGNCWLCNILPE